MDHSRDSAPRRLPSPHSPAPIALSEFMAQTTPLSDSSPSEGAPAALVPDAPETKAVGKPTRDTEEDTLQGDQDESQVQTPKHDSQETQVPPQDTPPIDWLSTRAQLLPRKNQGNKADWVRGWSEAVSAHGEETYCACSGALDENRGRKAKTNEFADSVRAMLQGGRSSSTSSKLTTTTSTSSEPEICRHCSRPSSPPTPSETPSTASDATPSQKGRSLSKRLTELLMRVRPRQSRSAHSKRNPEMRQLDWSADYHPRWATTTGPDQKRFLARPPSQPVTRRSKSKSQSMDIFPSRVGAKIGTTPSSLLSGTSDSDGPRGRKGGGLSRSVSRLQRAAALLQRGTRPKE